MLGNLLGYWDSHCDVDNTRQTADSIGIVYVETHSLEHEPKTLNIGIFKVTLILT